MNLSDVKIERDVPVPKTRKKLNQKPWCDMQPGDSFFVRARTVDQPPLKDGPVYTRDEIEKLRKTLMYLAGKYWGAGNWSVMAAERDGAPGFRVWRRS